MTSSNALVLTRYTAIDGIERSNISTRGADFASYLSYSRFFEMQLSSIFRDVVERGRSVLLKSDDIRVGGYLSRVNDAIAMIRASNGEVSQRSVSETTGLSRHTLRKYTVLSQAIQNGLRQGDSEVPHSVPAEP